MTVLRAEDFSLLCCMLLSVGSLGWFDRTCSLQQDQWTEDRFRPGCHQSEGGRTGKGVSHVNDAVWLLSLKGKKKRKCLYALKRLNRYTRQGYINLTLTCFNRLEHGILPVV